MIMMAAVKSITSSVALGGVALLSVSANATERDTTLKALPMHGVSFDIGSKHAISYFLVKDGNCDLTVWLVEISREDEVVPSTPARMAIAVAPGKTMQVGSAEGTVAEFACAANADSMSVRTFTEVAYAKRL
jgi:hypothetical protein